MSIFEQIATYFQTRPERQAERQEGRAVRRAARQERRTERRAERADKTIEDFYTVQTPEGLVRETPDAPEAIRQTLQAPLRAPVSIGLSVNKFLRGENARENFTPPNKLGEFIFGPEPIVSIGEKGEETILEFGGKETTAQKPAVRAAVGALAVGLDASDLFFGPGKKKLVKEVVQSNQAENIIKMLADSKFFKGGADEAAEVAKELAQITDPREVERIIGRENTRSLVRNNLTKAGTDIDQADSIAQVVADEADAILRDNPNIGQKEFADKLDKTITDQIQVNKMALDKVNKADNLIKREELQDAMAEIVGESVPTYKRPLNVRNLNTSETNKKQLLRMMDDLGDALKKDIGEAITHEEVLLAAKGSDILRKANVRPATKKIMTEIQALKEQIVAQLEAGTVGPELMDNIRSLRLAGADAGRILNSFRIGADPLMRDAKFRVLSELDKLGKATDDMLAKADKVDFSNEKETIAFWRSIVKPTVGEIVDEMRYINLLSSPLTHIVNATSNLIQAGFLAPVTKLATGAVDFVASALPGQARKQYVREVPEFYRGAINSIGDSFSKFREVMLGTRKIERPDLERVPTNLPLLRQLQLIPRLLEGMDIFFRNMIREGEMNALMYRANRQGLELNDVNLAKLRKEAEKTGEYYVFRKKPDASAGSGQGHLLRFIDAGTGVLQQAREKVPGVKWFIPFIQTPMNIFKQGIEYSPLGFATTFGAKNKKEQLAKALVGSTVFAGAGWLALSGNTTWAAPTQEKDRELFYASGRKPYSIKVGNKWVSYSKLGPLAYPIAMAAGAQYHFNENPKNVDENTVKKLTDVLGGIAQFFSDQSYVQGIGEMVDAARGVHGKDPLSTAAQTFPQQLVPLASLQRWVNNFIDPVFRKGERGLSGKAFIDQIAKGIPFASKTVDAYTDPLGDPSKKKFVAGNAFNPFQMTPVDERFEDLYQLQLEARRRKQPLQEAKDELRELAQEQLDILDQLDSRDAHNEWLRIRAVDEDLAEEIANLKEKKELKPVDRSALLLFVNDGSRAKFLHEEVFGKIKSAEEKEAVWNHLRETGTISKTVAKQLKNLMAGRPALAD